MNEMTNKEFSFKFQKYLLTQPPEVVAQICANAFIDLNRFLNIDSLHPEEARKLIVRANANTTNAYKAIKENYTDGIDIIDENNQYDGIS